MDDALRKLAQSVQVIRSLHRSAGGDVEGYATKGAVTDPLELAKSVKPLHRSGGGRDDAPKEPTIGSILKRGQPIQPSTPNPTPAEITAARADTRTSAQHVNQRLNTIVPESSRVVGGTYSAGAPNGGRWADLPQQFLNQPGIGFKITPQIRQADALHKRALADLEQNPNSEFHKAAVNQTGSNLAEAHKGGDAVLQHLWGQAVNESSQAAKNAVAQHGVKPMFGSHDWDQSMSLPLRDHLWYELSGEKMAENLPDLTPSEYLKGMDLVGATSARAEPGENLERGLGVLSQHLRGVPADVDLTIPSTVRQALSRSHTGGSSALPGNKTGHFSDTLALTGGVPTRFPISVNDVWVGKMFGVPDDVMSSNQSLHEPMALYFNKIRDLYNNVHGHELPFKYQSWNFQAPAWVHLRNEPSGDAYHQVWGGIINKLQKAGVPGIQGDKITREALIHPKFADALRRTTEGFRSSPKATVEFGTTQTPIGAQAAELYHHAVENGDQISQDQYLKGLTTAMFQSSRGKHPWDMLKKAVTGDVTGASDITRISTPTSDSPFDSGGTFEGAVSPNIRIPLKGMDDEQIAMMHAIAGHHLKQDAMATSTVHMANSNEEPREDHVRGHSLFVPTTDPIHPDHIRSLAKALSANGHDMSFTRHPNGYMFDTIPRFDDEGAQGIDHDTLRQAANQSLGNLYPTGKIMAHDFKSVYNPSSEYADYKSKLLKRMHDDFTRESFDQEPSENNARKAIVGPKGPNPPSGRSKKAWNTYTQRLNYLAAAEEGFKNLASRVNDSHSKFIDDAHKRMERAGNPFVGPLRNITPEHDARGGSVRRAYMKGGKVEGSIWHERDAFGFGGDTESAGSAPERSGSGTVAAEHEAAPEQHEQRQSDPEGREHPSSEAEKLANQGTFPSWAGFNSGGNEAEVNKSAADVAASRLAQAERMSVLNNGVTNAQATAAETPPSAASAANAAMSAAFAPVGATTSFGQQPPQAGLFTPEHFESTLEQNLVEPAFSQPMTQPAFPHTPTPTADTATHLGGTPATGVIPDTATHLGGTPATGALGVTQPSFPHTPTPTTATPVSVAPSAPASTNTPMSQDLSASKIAGTPPAGFTPITPDPVGYFFDRMLGGFTSQGIHNPAGYSLGLPAGNPNSQQGQALLDQNARTPSSEVPRGGKSRMVQKLMPDGTYQWVEEPFKKGGKVYRPLVGSQMTDHVISKFGVPLSASKYQPNGNKAGRR